MKIGSGNLKSFEHQLGTKQIAIKSGVRVANGGISPYPAGDAVANDGEDKGIFFFLRQLCSCRHGLGDSKKRHK